MGRELVFLSVIQIVEDRASAAAMVEMTMAKLLVLCVNRIWWERRFLVRDRRKSDEIGISKFLRNLSVCSSKIVPDYTSTNCMCIAGGTISTARRPFHPTLPTQLQQIQMHAKELGLEHVANDVVHPLTKETRTNYKKLIADPILHDISHD